MELQEGAEVPQPSGTDGMDTFPQAPSGVKTCETVQLRVWRRRQLIAGFRWSKVLLTQRVCERSTCVSCGHRRGLDDDGVSCP